VHTLQVEGDQIDPSVTPKPFFPVANAACHFSLCLNLMLQLVAIGHQGRLKCHCITLPLRCHFLTCMLGAGLVFVPLSQPYLHEYGDDWITSSPRRLVDKALNGLMDKPGQQIIVMSQVLVDDINTSYQQFQNLQVGVGFWDALADLSGCAEV
jgi:hypothetical protein